MQWPLWLHLTALLLFSEEAQYSCDSQAQRWQTESCFHRHTSLLHPCGQSGSIFQQCLESEPHRENALSTSVSLLYWLGAWPSGILPLFSFIFLSSSCLLFPSQPLPVANCPNYKTSSCWHLLLETDVRMAKDLKSCVYYKGWIYVAHCLILWSMSFSICWWNHNYIRWSNITKSLRFLRSLNQVIFASSKIALPEDRSCFPQESELHSVYCKSLNDLP